MRIETEKEKKKKKKSRVSTFRREVHVAIANGPHRISKHLVMARPPLFSPLRGQTKKSKKSSIFFYIIGRVRPYLFEISTTSLLIFLGWLIVRIAIVVFRLPSAKISTEVATVPIQSTYLERETFLKRVSQWVSVVVARLVSITASGQRERKSVAQLQPKKESSSFAFWTQGSMRQAATFAVVSLVLIVPIWLTGQITTAKAVSGDVAGALRDGARSFAAGASSFELGRYDVASTTFETSLKAFAEAKHQLDQLPDVISVAATALPQGKTLSSVHDLLNAADATTAIAKEVAGALAFLNAKSGKTQLTLDGAFQTLQSIATSVTPRLSVVAESLRQVNASSLPAPYETMFTQLQQSILPPLVDTVRSLSLVNFISPELSGGTEPKRYLFVFQDDYELRASGGFMGSFALVDVVNGKIKNIEFPGGGTYDLKGALTVQEKPPQPLSLVASRWEFQDANWWSDWPTSAQKIAWFYAHSGGSSVDGVVAVDTQFMRSLLTITGPISLAKYGVTIDKDNFVQQLFEEVEVNYDHAKNTPKQILADLLPVMLDRVAQKATSDGFDLLNALRSALAEKHVLVYSDNKNVERALTELGWAGELPARSVGSDSLSVVHTNIAGQKTDGVITNAVTHGVQISQGGSLVVTVSVTRTHHGVKGMPFTGVRNVDYLRVYVPQGSQIVNAEGFESIDPMLFKTPQRYTTEDPDLKPEREGYVDRGRNLTVYNELQRTVFAGWLTVDPGAEKTVTITYRLPWRLTHYPSASDVPWLAFFSNEQRYLGYTFYWEKQPGTGATDLTHSITDFTHRLLIASTSKDPTIIGGNWVWRSPVSNDLAIATLFSQQKP